MTMTDATDKPKGKRGRPTGLPRSGGRAKGVPNRANQISREYIVRQGAPIAFLCNVVRGFSFKVADVPGGKKTEKVFPTLDQRIAAARILAAKVAPDLKAQELSGKDGAPLLPPMLAFLDQLPAPKS